LKPEFDVNTNSNEMMGLFTNFKESMQGATADQGALEGQIKVQQEFINQLKSRG